jgi:hypothetical protein
MEKKRGAVQRIIFKKVVFYEEVQKESETEAKR